MPSKEKKEAYAKHLINLINTYTKIVVVGADHVGSKQFMNMRKSMRGEAIILMGKNTMIRKIIREFLKSNPEHPIENLINCIEGNVGLIFTNGSLSRLSDIIDENVVPAAAKTGAMAEVDVLVPAGPTGCDPGQTSWFQALNVPTKIVKGQIEIVSDLKLISVGEKVGASEAGLLLKLEIFPFSYGLKLLTVYDDGAIFPAAVLKITEDALKAKFFESVRRLAALGREVGLPTLASLPHALGQGVKTLLAIASQTGVKLGQHSEAWDALFAPEEPAAEEAAAE